MKTLLPPENGDAEKKELRQVIAKRDRTIVALTVPSNEEEPSRKGPRHGPPEAIDHLQAPENTDRATPQGEDKASSNEARIDNAPTSNGNVYRKVDDMH
ncbi:hypothetical protein FBEOM_12714 [Fusarium beomiforme]|uniref:Uncharacterized protein n=1 Tax=Fusarium beomiforme TaxID=44412 RepID=A0A9P5DT50_9HYPO|nr:hypothetical protein FBEOM_12714 [Fusarium beomiforme]